MAFFRVEYLELLRHIACQLLEPVLVHVIDLLQVLHILPQLQDFLTTLSTCEAFMVFYVVQGLAHHRSEGNGCTFLGPQGVARKAASSLELGWAKRVVAAWTSRNRFPECYKRSGATSRASSWNRFSFTSSICCKCFTSCLNSKIF